MFLTISGTSSFMYFAVFSTWRTSRFSSTGDVSSMMTTFLVDLEKITRSGRRVVAAIVDRIVGLSSKSALIIQSVA